MEKVALEERAPNEAPDPQKCEQLAEWAAGRRFEDISPDQVPYLKTLVLDTLGCAIGALDHQPVRAARSLTVDLGGSAWCTLAGGGRSSPDRATFFNGACIRYLDFMDIAMIPGQSFHPSDNFAAALAAAEMAGASGRQLLTALAVAYQVQTRFSDRAPLQEKGFDHVTHLAFSVPAACISALGLDRRAGGNAIAMCGSAINALWLIRTARVSGWKGFASAQAAMACVHMTLLSTRGLTGPLNLMEGPEGWEDVIGDRVEVDWKSEPLDAFTRSSIKRYNAEGHTQSALECLLDLRAEHGIEPRDVSRVEVDTFKQVHNIVGGGQAGDRSAAWSKEQADHSLPYLCAVALLDGDVWPDQLTDERVRRDDVQDLMRRVWVRQREELSLRYPNEMPSRVTVLLRDGHEHTGEKVDFHGFWRTRPLGWDDAIGKFERLASPGLDAKLRREIPEAVWALDEIPVSELCELLGRAGAGRAAAGA